MTAENDKIEKCSLSFKLTNGYDDMIYSGLRFNDSSNRNLVFQNDSAGERADRGDGYTG